jgi:hypothetical protein
MCSMVWEYASLWCSKPVASKQSKACRLAIGVWRRRHGFRHLDVSEPRSMSVYLHLHSSASTGTASVCVQMRLCTCSVETNHQSSRATHKHVCHSRKKADDNDLQTKFNSRHETEIAISQNLEHTQSQIVGSLHWRTFDISHNTGAHKRESSIQSNPTTHDAVWSLAS